MSWKRLQSLVALNEEREKIEMTMKAAFEEANINVYTDTRFAEGVYVCRMTAYHATTGKHICTRYGQSTHSAEAENAASARLREALMKEADEKPVQSS